MSRRHDDLDTITPDMVLRAYAIGIFPMAESVDDPSIHWIEPKFRGIFPLDDFKISKSLAKTIRSDRFVVRVNTDFEAVINACAVIRPDTWINGRIRALYRELFALGHVHTVEAWIGPDLVGGLYGVSLGGAFFGESMFHTVTDASKVALAHLVARLVKGGYTLLDTQFITPHLASLGAIEIPRRNYQARLKEAISRDADFSAWPEGPEGTGQRVLDAIASRHKDQI